MAFKLFKGKKGDADAEASSDAAAGEGGGDGKKSEKGSDDNGFHRDQRKADAFFRHATATADSRQWDYSIECYINGLRHEPDNMFRHEELFEVSLKRKVAGGKPAGMMEKLKGGGKSNVDKMLHAEMLWAKEPQNLTHMAAIVKHAAAAHEEHKESGDLDLRDLILWVGDKLLATNANSKKPTQQIFVDVRDTYAQIGEFQKAVDAGRLAVQMGDDSGKLMSALKDLEAEATMQRQFASQDSRDAQADKEGQRQRNLEDATDLTESALQELIDKQREQYEADPDDLPMLQKLVKSYVRMNNDEGENEAISLLLAAYKRTDAYNLKMAAGDIKMRQYRRHLTDVKKQFQADPEDKSLREKFDEIARQRAEYELGEYAERVEKYPTQLDLKFQLGRRKLEVKAVDDAIALFQQAQADPKIRAACCNFLGMCYRQKGWYDEAAQTLEVGIETHPLPDDALGMELRYQRMDALEQMARKHKSMDQARAAQKVGSELLQANINYRDIRDRVDKLRKLLDELQSGG